MALQPASGAKDLNPKQVETNHLLVKKLAQVYSLWGYEEVSPSFINTIETIKGRGVIEENQLVAK